MSIQLTGFQHRIPKRGNKDIENEDYFAPNLKPFLFKLERRTLFAISDGATETSFSNFWASILAHAFVDEVININNWQISSLDPLIDEWRAKIQTSFKQQQIPWYVEEKLSFGAYSTLLGLEIGSDFTWKSICFGDSCLFHIRDGQITNTFPYMESNQFRSRPKLLSTHISANQGIEPFVLTGKYILNDVFLLMTDALSEALLSYPDHLLSLLLDVKNKSKFKQIIEQLRDKRLCRNDDVAFIRIELVSNEANAK